MNSRAILYLCVLLSMSGVFPATVQSQGLLVPLNGKTENIFHQLMDIELLEQNIVHCYQTEKGAFTVGSLARHSWGEPAELDGKLLNRVFERLSGTPEYERFINVYRSVIQQSDYSRPYASELFAEYMRLLESARTRLTTQLRATL